MLAFGTALAMAAGCDSNEANVELPPPELVGPVDDAYFHARSFVEFSWTPVEGATSYEVYFEYEDYPVATVTVSALDRLTVYRLTEIGRVNWRVRAISGDGGGEWSTVRSLVAQPTILSGVWESNFDFSTSGLEVGEEVFVVSNLEFAPVVLSPVADYGATRTEVRDLLITNFRIEITDPPGTVIDQFSSWRVTLTSPQGEDPILALIDPAPAVSLLDVPMFQRPEDWISKALDITSVVGVRAQVNPRSPKEANIHWNLSIDYSVTVNR